MYQIIWSDPCSDVFFSALEKSFTWIATLNALEGASGCALGYIDYKVKYKTPTEKMEDSFIIAMRKKRLAFAKVSFMMAMLGLLLIDTPTANCVVPLILSSIYTSVKLATQVAHEMTPDRFF